MQSLAESMTRILKSVQFDMRGIDNPSESPPRPPLIIQLDIEVLDVASTS